MKKSIEKVIKKHHDFNFYQTIDFKGEIIKKGIRTQERRNYIDLHDIKGKKIVDLGASTGAEAIWALSVGAEHVDMVEREERQCKIISDFIEEIQKTKYKDRLMLHQFDLNKGLPEKIKDKKVDTVFCYAIIQYLGYKKIWKDINGVETIYLETGADAHLSEDFLSDNIFSAKKICTIKEKINNIDYERALYKIKRKKS
jgi:translation elongation factor EF-G